MENYALVARQEEEEELKSGTGEGTKHEGKSSTSAAAKIVGAPAAGWSGHGGLEVGGGRVQRNEWESGIFGCFGKNDDFYSSDLEVCETFISLFYFIFFMANLI